MKSPSKRLFSGALLGDVVESLTGSDVVVQRSDSNRSTIAGSSAIRCSHNSRAFAGHTLVGKAKVIWIGAPEGYSKLLKVRMKDHLKHNRVRPTNESFDADNQVLSRHFVLKSRTGTLLIHEKIFIKRIQSLSDHTNGSNGTNSATQKEAST